MRNFSLFSGTSNLPLAKKVAQKLNIKLGEIEIKRFKDGECRVRIKETLQGKSVYLLQSLSKPVDENIFELCLMINSAKRQKAEKIIALIPWLGYSKQDKEFRKGESVSCEVIAQILESIGLSKMVVFDLHSQNIKNYYQIPLMELSAQKILASKLKKYKNIVIISPDKGGKARAEVFAKKNNFPIVYLQKQRNLETGKITYEKLNKDLTSKTAVIFDDIINTGGTIIKSARLLKKQNAKKIIVLATHAVLANSASHKLQKSPASKIYLTDTINVSQSKRFPKLEIVTVSNCIASFFKNNLKK